MPTTRARRWRLRVLLAVLLLAAVVMVPIHITTQSGRGRAVARALDELFGRGNEEQPIVYLEAGAFLPEGPTTIGNQPVEVVSRRTMRERFAGVDYAPELESVQLTEEHGLLGVTYEVTIHTSRYLPPGVSQHGWGGATTYSFRQWWGFPWLSGKGSVDY